MHIQHANKQVWLKPLSADPLVHFGKNNRTRIRTTLNKIAETNIAITIEPLHESFFTWFEPLYQKTISEKNNPKLWDIRATTLHNTTHEFPYYSLALYEDDTPIGGTIFSVRPERISIAYRVYPHTWNNVNLPANPSYYTEYRLCEYGYSLGKPILSHGTDRNPYGVNASIGLAMFKLSIGCSPEVPPTYEVQTFDSSTLTVDALVLELPSEGTKITKAHLFTHPDTETKYQQLLKYPEQLPVISYYR